MKELIYIQANLKAPKGQRNTFGNYNYRSAEDILEAVKPLLAEQLCTLTVYDEMVEVGGRIYVKATALLKSEKEQMQTTAFAREEETKKGMDAAQITGSASSYARKYALNGLFCIDDTKDPDSTNTHGTEKAPEKVYTKSDALKDITACQSYESIVEVWKKGAAFQKETDFIEAVRLAQKNYPKQ